jgi:hypothetical protein
MCTYVGFYVALVQSKTVRFSDLAQNFAKIKMSKISVSFYWTQKKYKKDRAGGVRQFELFYRQIGHKQIGF